jgi:cytidylate kinase
MERLIVEAADRGNAVIVGRGANGILAGRPGLVRVFLRAPLDWRVAHVAESLAVDEPAARAEVARVDGGRRAFARERHGIEWGHPRAYDLVVDTSAFGAAGTVAIVAAAVEARA